MPTATDNPSIFNEDFYVAARENRLRNLFQHLPPEFFKGKRILELGCGAGDLGQRFVDLGAYVLSVDAKAEYLAECKQKFPDRPTAEADLENFDPAQFTGFDILLSFGLLYHIEKPTAFLQRCSRIAPLMLLETVVCDSSEIWYERVAEVGPGQAFSGYGCRPSAAWISCVLADANFSTLDISSGIANWAGPYPSVFDWPIKNDRSWIRGNTFLRKMFICRKAR